MAPECGTLSDVQTELGDPQVTWTYYHGNITYELEDGDLKPNRDPLTAEQIINDDDFVRDCGDSTSNKITPEFGGQPSVDGSITGVSTTSTTILETS